MIKTKTKSKVSDQALIQQQKQKIRNKVRKIRSQITGVQATKAGLALAEQLKKNEKYIKAKHIACFLSFDGEIETKALIDMVIKDKGICYLPKLKPTKPNRLWFMPYHSNSKLDKNRLGIPEVNLPVNHAIAVSKIDLILMPLVAFDLEGNRIGMGGGFYDATLSHLVAKKFAYNCPKPLSLGIAYQQQMIKKAPSQDWDFPLDGVLTEENLYWF
jgi:5-formyltetrahydrofolate cyclo-ligase